MLEVTIETGSLVLPDTNRPRKRIQWPLSDGQLVESARGMHAAIEDTERNAPNRSGAMS